jgi:hypothetical protein
MALICGGKEDEKGYDVNIGLLNRDFKNDSIKTGS